MFILDYADEDRGVTGELTQHADGEFRGARFRADEYPVVPPPVGNSPPGKYRRRVTAPLPKSYPSTTPAVPRNPEDIARRRVGSGAGNMADTSGPTTDPAPT